MNTKPPAQAYSIPATGLPPAPGLVRIITTKVAPAGHGQRADTRSYSEAGLRGRVYSAGADKPRQA